MDPLAKHGKYLQLLCAKSRLNMLAFGPAGILREQCDNDRGMSMKSVQRLGDNLI
jgi:hypothetical protein